MFLSIWEKEAELFPQKWRNPLKPVFIIVFPLEAFQSQIQSKILTINSDFPEISCNHLFVLLIEPLCNFCSFFFFNEHAFLLSDDDSDSSFEKEKNGSSTGAFGQDHNEPRRGWGVMNVGSSVLMLGPSLGCWQGAPNWCPKPDITWLCLFWLYSWFPVCCFIHLSNSVFRNGSAGLFLVF